MSVQEGTIEFFKGNKEAIEAYNLIQETKEHVFLMGKAGSGKSTLLRTILKNTKKSFIVVAPTGIAARNAGGSTLHSMFRLPMGIIFPDTKDVRNIFYKEEKEYLFRRLQLLIIDEISMIPSFVLDVIDYLLRNVRGIEEPFGGVQIFATGDIFQLNPIIKFNERTILNSRYKSEMFFDSHIFNIMNFNEIELKKCYRQSDKEFMNLLDGVRDKTIKLSTLANFNEVCLNTKIDERDLRVTLAPANEKVEQINRIELAKLDAMQYTFEGAITEIFDIKNCIADQFLNLKKDCHVMFIKNKPQEGFINGTMGIVQEVNEEKIVVRTEEGLIVDVQKEVWDDYDFVVNKETGDIEREIIGSLTQYPLKLAYALSIHKSQGLTFKHMTLDTGNGIFATGQLYVALSRCTTMQGIKLINKILYREILINKKIVEYYNKFKMRQNASIKK